MATLTMSLQQRLALLAWAAGHDAAIVEDYDSKFSATRGRPVEPVQALDTNGRVMYVGSFCRRCCRPCDWVR